MGRLRVEGRVGRALHTWCVESSLVSPLVWGARARVPTSDPTRVYVTGTLCACACVSPRVCLAGLCDCVS